MTGAILMFSCVILIGVSLHLFLSGLRQAETDRVLERLAAGQPLLAEERGRWVGLERMFLRAGLGKPTDSLGLWLTCWVLGAVLGFLVWSWVGLLAMLLLPPLILRLYIAWRYRRRVKRMIEQLPQVLDHTVRSLKSGRTLADALLGAIDSTEEPLKPAMGRIQRNVQLGVSLPEAASDFAEFYEQDEFRMLALGLKVNHRYGGNASDLLENLIKVIREREQGARQLRAMTGETRVTAFVLAGMPIAMVGYFMLINPGYLMTMWNDDSGRYMLLAALSMQVLGCLTMWRIALLFLAALVLIAGQLLNQRRRERLVNQRLQGQLVRGDRLGTLLSQFGSSQLAQRSVSMDNETQLLLNRVGWRKANQRSIFAACQIGVPLLLAGVMLVGQSLIFPNADSPWIAPLLGLGVGYLIPKRILA
eukprot:gene21466-21408_t